MKKNNRFLALSGIGLQMGATIYLGAMGGKYLDANYNEDGTGFTVACTLAAVALSFFNLLRQVNKINEKDN